MGDWWETESFKLATRFLDNMGYTWKFEHFEPTKRESGDSVFVTPSGYQNTGFMVLNNEATDKNTFYHIFENNGWQPIEKEISRHGPRAGSVNEIDSAGYHIATIWEIQKDNLELSAEIRKISESMEAEIMAEMGKGNNMRIYIWSGYMAFYPDGYSNMTLIEWFNDDANVLNLGQTLKPDGEVYFGEKAFKKLKKLRTRIPIVGFYPSINRVSIT